MESPRGARARRAGGVALQHLHQEIVLTRKNGSVTLEESLARLARENIVDVEEARSRAAHPEEFETYLRG